MKYNLLLAICLLSVASECAASVTVTHVSSSAIVIEPASIPGSSSVGQLVIRARITAPDDVDLLIPEWAFPWTNSGNASIAHSVSQLTAMGDKKDDSALGFKIDAGESRLFEKRVLLSLIRSGIVGIEVPEILVDIYPGGSNMIRIPTPELRTDMIYLEVMAIPEPRQGAFIAVAIIGGIVGLAVARRGRDSKWRRNLRRMNAQSRRLEKQFRQRGW